MLSKKVKVINENGLHMKPSMMIVDLLSNFKCDVTLAREDGPAIDAKSIMQLAMQACTDGDEVTISTDGPNEDKAMDALVALFENGFDEMPEIKTLES